MKLRLATIFAITLLSCGGFFWLKAEHRPQQAIDQAQTFVNLLQLNKLEDAYQLTLKNELVGKTDADFATLVKQQMCGVNKHTTTFPFQSNGNRMRRWIAGRPIEPSDITVEFTGSCLFGVTLRYVAGGMWKVYFFQSHAG
jgi:hypothetical protein